MACNTTTVALQYHFYQNGGAPVCREHLHTGRPHTRIDNSVFKKSNVMSSMKKKTTTTTEKLETRKKIKISAKVKINKHKYAVAKRCSEKNSYFEN